ncbi:uncharacterized protein LOC124154957 [Ischnura elegans]|uniref:uncharacterized protein LOC124154957 n=1 Tax=Ischnura elegans TaxID=197161 RepID=UPI001ED87436|nr:uncharacterized protein LOC124154957 [Ischnura elegans]
MRRTNTTLQESLEDPAEIMGKMNKTTAIALLLIVLSLMGASNAGKIIRPCENVCLAIFQPVCAVSSCGKTRVFSNSCELEQYNCRYPKDQYTATSKKACPDFPIGNGS